MAIKDFTCLKEYIKDHGDWRTESFSSMGQYNLYSVFIFLSSLGSYLLLSPLTLAICYLPSWMILFCFVLLQVVQSSIATLPPKPDLTSSLSYLPKILELNQFLRILNPQMLVYDVAMWQKSMTVHWEMQYLFNVNSCKVWTVIFWKRLGTVSQDDCWGNVWTLLWSVNHLNKRCVWLAIFNWR